jgi:hypothetical protein
MSTEKRQTPNDSGRKISVGESELGRAACLVAEIVEGREAGNRDERAGNSDEDLLGAVEELESGIRNWRASR